jgi:hypothetical protein
LKLIRTKNDQLTFSLGRKEKQLLVQILKMYPLVPSSHHRLCKTNETAVRAEDQRLLDEAVAEQRNQNRKRIQVFLDDPRRFHEAASVIKLLLMREEIEWLLQVLNDVRVGAWLALGEPDELSLPEINETNAPTFFAMEVSGHFQTELLAALGHHQPTSLDEM